MTFKKPTDLRRYLMFTRSIWGSLTNFSVLFPFSALLIEQAGISPQYATLSSVMCAGVVFAVWVGRTDSWLFEMRGGLFLNLTICGTVSLLLGGALVFIFFFTAMGFSPAVHFHRIVLYLCGFAGLTAAFSAFALKEFFLTQDELGFDVHSMTERIIRCHVIQIARKLNVKRGDLRVTEQNAGTQGIKLTIELGAEQFSAEIDMKGRLKAFTRRNQSA